MRIRPVKPRRVAGVAASSRRRRAPRKLHTACPRLPISGTLGGVRYEWDNDKAAANLRKHGVDFADAVEDTDHVEEIDTRFAYAEERIQIIGMARGRVLFVVVTLTRMHAKSYRLGRPHDMSKSGITRVTMKPGEPLPRGNTDWARLDAMTDEEVAAAARSDPDAQPLTPEQLANMRRVSRVKTLRQRLG